MTPTPKLRGEAVARRPGRCRLCRQPIGRGDALVDVSPIGWVHARCGQSYVGVFAEHDIFEAAARDFAADLADRIDRRDRPHGSRAKASDPMDADPWKGSHCPGPMDAGARPPHERPVDRPGLMSADVGGPG